MEIGESTREEVYISRPEKLDPKKIVQAIGPWKVYGLDKGFRFESPQIPGLPNLEMVITKDEFSLNQVRWTRKDPAVFLRNVRKVEIHGPEIGIESDDGNCYIWQQGLKARIFFGKSKKGKTAAVSVSFGDSPRS
ncbi:MAG: hypothetical protein UU34_C0002G0030 [Candidatus Curtissbacteria bacterium GW2011_GWA1_41_11]|uniref:Uncharacterized protein n=1 Tax=Candidatus Curtissbacteria bacterium GW2011_GWA1_41_11 TaxID=1618409 RepID=A0A0G0UG84_9BACT|nr:MAG: hypothetical protein UU34_C0002G0030 [Candidatus Curtissbacteria bacterium GW2011_GWA1_41_11]